LEKVDLRSARDVAKIIGTIVCLAGAMLMAFFKGPKLLGALLTDDWVIGGTYLMGNAICFSIWYILQASTLICIPFLFSYMYQIYLSLF
jgi:hypothetical protein